jgi:hypothetical protein
MRWLIFAGTLIAASGFVTQAAVRQFPWIKARTAKKADPVQTRVAYHGTTAWSSEGRLHFPSDRNAPPVVTHAKARVAKSTR